MNYTPAAETVVATGGTENNLQSSDNTGPVLHIVCDRYNNSVGYPLWLLRNYPRELTGEQRWKIYSEM